MTIIATEIQKWKRNKIVWCILALTLLFGAFAIERACSIARSSPYMDSFGDLYTLAFKNLSSLFLPIVLGMFATTLFFDEHKNDTLKELLIIPITKAQLYFSKVAVVILMSVGLCLITFLLCVVGGLIAAIYPWEDPVALVCDDEGLLKGYELNRLVSRDTIITGTFFICGLAEDNFTSLPDEYMEKYERLFRYPEIFVRTGAGVMAIPMTE